MNRRPKSTGNIVGFINNTQLRSTFKQTNCIFESREGNRVFVCGVKSIAARKELLINYNLNRVDTNTVSMTTGASRQPVNLNVIPHYKYFKTVHI